MDALLLTNSLMIKSLDECKEVGHETLGQPLKCLNFIMAKFLSHVLMVPIDIDYIGWEWRRIVITSLNFQHAYCMILVNFHLEQNPHD